MVSGNHALSTRGLDKGHIRIIPGSGINNTNNFAHNVVATVRRAPGTAGVLLVSSSITISPRDVGHACGLLHVLGPRRHRSVVDNTVLGCRVNRSR